jgi:hypothetical protein
MPRTGQFIEAFAGYPTPVGYDAGTPLTDAAGVPLYGLVFTVRDEGGATLLKLTSAAGRITIPPDPYGVKAAWTITAADLANVPAGQHAWDVALTDLNCLTYLDPLDSYGNTLMVHDLPSSAG